ncbi:MAG TPA: ABC transporter permease [Candidatus Acidoferrales bacterium]
MTSFLIHLKGGVRMLLRDRSLACVCLLALALGIGVSTAMFSVLHAVVLEPFPFPDQNKIVVGWKADPKNGVNFVELSYLDYKDWRDQSKSFQDLAAMPTTVYGYSYVLSGRGESKQIESARVAANFFSVLGIQPSLGRVFNSEEDRVNANPVVILTHHFWENEFSSDRNIVGSGITLSGSTFTVVGVLPAGFMFPQGVDIFTPLATNGLWTTRRGATFLQVLGRLKPGVSISQANVELNAIQARVAAAHPESKTDGQIAFLQPLPEFITGANKTVVYLLFLGSLILLLIASVNLASLLVTKSVAREGEIAIRVALGASRKQLFSQFLAEGLILSTFGAAIGVAVAAGLLPIIKYISPRDIPRIESVSPNGWALLFALICLVLTTCVFALAPLVLIRDRNLQKSLRNLGNTVAGGMRSRRLGPVFLIAQVSASLALLVLAGTVGKSVHNLQNARLGFDPDHVFTCFLSLSGTKYATPAAGQAFYKTLIDNLQARPEVIAAGAVLIRPLEGPIGWEGHYVLPGQDEETAKNNPIANLEAVTPNYFQAIGTPILQGRAFQLGEDRSKPPVAIISESVARNMYGSTAQALGQSFKFSGDSRSTQIVGVVADGRYRGLNQATGDIFVSYEQSSLPERYLVVRSRNNPAAMASVVRDAISRIDGTQADSREATMTELVDRALSQDRFYGELLLFFAAGALLLAAIGVYGVVSDMVVMRTKEFGIRVVLGAQPGAIVRAVLRSTLSWVLLGEIAGVLAGILAAFSMRAKLFGVSATDGLSISASSALLIVVSLVACVAPVLRATRLDPNRVLRE